MASPLDLLIPPRLIMRAADDLHKLVGLGERAMSQLERLEERADRVLALGETIESQATQIIAMGDTISGQATDIIGMGDRVSGQAEQIIGVGDRVSGQADGITDLAERLEKLGREMLEQGVVISARADAVATRAADLVDALPTIEHAVTMVSPLEGAVERLGRAVDRLPGGKGKAAVARRQLEDEQLEPEQDAR